MGEARCAGGRCFVSAVAVFVVVLGSLGAAARAASRPPGLRAPLTVARVWAVGDGANGSATAQALAHRIASSGADLFLYLGDVYPDGTPADFANGYATTYGVLAPITAPTPGNHDWPNSASGYFPWWSGAQRIAPPAYYAFGVSGWTILSLNSEAPHDPSSPQLAWLRARLRGRGTCRLAFWHRPRWSGGMHGDEADIAPFWSALAGHARIVLNGHDHDMQRFAARDGIFEFVSGAGGADLYSIDRSHPGLAFADDTDFGALRLVLRPGRATYSFIDVRGRTLNTGTIRCRR
jgi:calcineurin-like phosphoesterase family protein